MAPTTISARPKRPQAVQRRSTAVRSGYTTQPPLVDHNMTRPPGSARTPRTVTRVCLLGAMQPVDVVEVLVVNGGARLRLLLLGELAYLRVHARQHFIPLGVGH